MYIASSQGKEAIALFEKDMDRAEELTTAIYTRFRVSAHNPAEIGRLVDRWLDIFIHYGFGEWENEEKALWDDFILLTTKQQKREFAGSIHLISCALYHISEHFKPLLLPNDFPRIQRSCDILGIELPPIPHTDNYGNYLYYYYDICTAFKKFQQANNLTDAEFCACLYDFAPNFLNDEQPQETDLPSPTNIWLTGASKYDVEEIERGGLKESVWACNERTRKGDIIIIYAVSPNSFLYAIGRAKTDGYFNPFNYYHCCAVFTGGMHLPHIPFKELKQHPYISQIPIFKKNLQGINGVELSPRDYAEIVALIRGHGCTDPLPELLHIANCDMPEVHNEKDVEESILIPFLTQVGYTSDDYTRQLVQQFGRNEKGIPDFVFFPHELMRHNHNAPFLIEAKYDMRQSAIERDKAFRQAFSYADKLRCSLFAVCDKERFTLYAMPRNGAPSIDNPVFVDYWANILTNEEVFIRIKKLVGRDAVKDLGTM